MQQHMCNILSLGCFTSEIKLYCFLLDPGKSGQEVHSQWS